METTILIEVELREGETEKREIKVGEDVTKITPKIIGERKDFLNAIDMEIPKGIQEIAKDSFSNCKKLKTAKIPDSVQIIYCGAFFGCDNLEEVTIEDIDYTKRCYRAFPKGTKIVTYSK